MRVETIIASKDLVGGSKCLKGCGWGGGCLKNKV